MRIAVVLVVVLAWCAAPAARADEDAATELGVPSKGMDVGGRAASDGAGGWVFGFDAGPVEPDGGFAPECKSKPDRGYLGVRTAAGRWRRVAVEPELDGGPVVTAERAAFLVATRNCRFQSAGDFAITTLRHLRLLRGPIGRRPTGLHLSDRAEAFGSMLAARAGRMAVAWLEPAGHGSNARDTSRLRVGRMAGPLGPALRIPGTLLQIAWVTDGRLLVLYQAAGSVRHREWTPRGGLGRPHTLSAVRGSAQLVLTLGQHDSGLAVWGSQSHGIEPDSPWVVQAAWLRRDGAGFRRVQTLERPEFVDDGGLVGAAIGADGIGTVAWASSRKGNPVMAAAARPGARLAPQQLAATSNISVFAFPAGGGTVVQWYGPDGDGPTEAARPPGVTTFGPAVPASGQRGLVYGADRVDSRIG